MTYYSVVVPKPIGFSWLDEVKTEVSFEMESEIVTVEVPDIKCVTAIHSPHNNQTRYVVDYYYKGLSRSSSVYCADEVMYSFDASEHFDYIHDLIYRSIGNEVKLDDNAWKPWHGHSAKQLGSYAGMPDKIIYANTSANLSSGTHAIGGAIDVYSYGNKPAKPVIPKINGKPISLVADELPCMNQTVPHPPQILSKSICENINGEPLSDKLKSMVIHLNDTHRWTREQIADWIDELHDNGLINAEFEPWEDSPVQDLDGWTGGWYTTEEGLAPEGES
jgi:hypothetical protein